MNIHEMEASMKDMNFNAERERVGKCQASFRNQLKLEPSDPVASAKKSIASPVQTFTISDVEMLSSDGGRIHLVGGEEKTSFEFVRGHFGGPPPPGAVRFVAADPIEACGTYIWISY